MNTSLSYSPSEIDGRKMHHRERLEHHKEEFERLNSERLQMVDKVIAEKLTEYSPECFGLYGITRGVIYHTLWISYHTKKLSKFEKLSELNEERGLEHA
ncbi:MAG: hypothetical protein NT120_03990 [Candidatus Aenigmarchaeota archaeon]|nr:hypothetical protein [Candidatus Aenigmarchaeota archaeon]